MLEPCPHSDSNSCEQYRLQGQRCQSCPLLESKPLIDPADLATESWPPRPVGGQHIGGWYTGVKITHLTSGLEAFANTERSQHRNRQIAMDMILGGLTSPHFR